MKKFLAVLVILFILSSLCFSVVWAEEGGSSNITAQDIISAEQIDKLTQDICEHIYDRTSFTEAIKVAVDQLSGKLPVIIENDDVESEVITFLNKDDLNIEPQLFQEKRNVIQGFRYEEVVYESYNIIVTPKAIDSSKKTILITTNFANHYAGIDGESGTKAEGALYNAATTALCISLANYLCASAQAEANLYNFAFVFFSGTDEGNYGSAAFAENYLRQEIMLVINLERLGCGTTYYYTDEAATEHGDFVAEIASGYDMKEFPQAGRILLDVGTTNDLPYSHYAMRGDISTFLDRNMTCLELIGGDYSGLTVGDSEGGKMYVTNTQLDTYKNLKSNYSDYADKLSKVGEFIIDLTAKNELADVCKGAATSYKVFAKKWIAYVVCLGIIIILILVLILVTGKLEKKYPIPKQPKIKIAVFGKEFEDFNRNEIVVDIKRDDKTSNNDVDPFNV